MSTITPLDANAQHISARFRVREHVAPGSRIAFSAGKIQQDLTRPQALTFRNCLNMLRQSPVFQPSLVKERLIAGALPAGTGGNP